MGGRGIAVAGEGERDIETDVTVWRGHAVEAALSDVPSEWDDEDRQGCFAFEGSELSAISRGGRKVLVALMPGD